MELKIRLGASEDRAFVLDLGSRTLDSSASAVRHTDRGDLKASYQRLVDCIFESSHVLLIAQSAAAPVGFLAFLDDLPDEVSGAPQGFVVYMAVEPHVRREGIASMLLTHAEEIARQRGLPALALMVTEGNEAARELYAQAGFVTERRLLVKTL